MAIRQFFSVYTQPKILAILLLGFSSGLPLALTASTLGVWLTDAGVHIKDISWFAVVGTPYALKFLWSPLIDATSFPLLSRWLGRRRGWLLATQIGVITGILLLGLANPAINPWLTAACALIVALCSASQDIVIDAYRVEILKPEQYGAGAAAVVMGYRLGMIVSSAGPLFLYAQVGWLAAYWLMAALMLVGVMVVLLCKEPDIHAQRPSYHGSIGQWLRDAVVAPFADFMTRDYWLPILLFIVLYKLADAFMGVMTNPFLITAGFTGPQIATILKVYGVIATIVGSVIGGALVSGIGARLSLWVCGIAHALTNLMFIEQARLGADTSFLTLSITLENISGGMGTAAFVAFISGLCNRRFTATQYALLSSLSAFGRTWLSTPAGWFAEKLGWEYFFALSAALALPGLMTLWWLSRRIQFEPDNVS